MPCVREILKIEPHRASGYPFDLFYWQHFTRSALWSVWLKRVALSNCVDILAGTCITYIYMPIYLGMPCGIFLVRCGGSACIFEIKLIFLFELQTTRYLIDCSGWNIFKTFYMVLPSTFAKAIAKYIFIYGIYGIFIKISYLMES